MTKTFAGITKKLQDIREELQEDIDNGSFTLDTMDDKESERLIEQLLEHCKLKRKGARATTKASHMDARQTIARIGDAVSSIFFLFKTSLLDILIICRIKMLC